MSTLDRTLATIEAFYDAAMDAALWPAALKNLTDLTGSQAASFWVLDASGGSRLPTFIYLNFDDKSVAEYLNGMAAYDPTIRYLVEHPLEAIVHDGLLGGARDNHTRAYDDWHERNVETRFRIVGQVRVAAGVQAGVALHRTRKAGKYEPQDIDRFSTLHGHLQRALAIALRIGSLGAFEKFSTEWLDRNSAGIILLDEHGRVVFANRAAQTLKTNSDGILLSSDGIQFAHRQANLKLQSLIAEALSSVASPGSGGGAMRASRPSGKRPFGIFVGPVSSQSIALSLFRPAVCIVITDPDRQCILPTQKIRAAFAPTDAEARLAALLASGEELRAAAGKLEITYGTARTRLAQIFQKTGSRRQSELILLLNALFSVDGPSRSTPDAPL
jgi:DNA-binding CsgD family transcriptional regulator